MFVSLMGVILVQHTHVSSHHFVRSRYLTILFVSHLYLSKSEERAFLEALPEDVAGAERGSPVLGQHLPLLVTVSAVLSREILWFSAMPLGHCRTGGSVVAQRDSEGLRLVYGPDCVMNKSCVFADTTGSQLRLSYP